MPQVLVRDNFFRPAVVCDLWIAVSTSDGGGRNLRRLRQPAAELGHSALGLPL